MKFNFSNGKGRMELTARDLQIFQVIGQEGAKKLTDLKRRFWSDKSKKAHAGTHRIRKLIKAGFLMHGDPRLLYLTDRAKELLSRHATKESSNQTLGLTELPFRVEGETAHAQS